MILYNNKKNPSFRKHVVTAHKIIFHTLFLALMDDQRLWLVMIPTPLREAWIPLYQVGKFQMMSTLALVQRIIIL